MHRGTDMPSSGALRFENGSLIWPHCLDILSAFRPRIATVCSVFPGGHIRRVWFSRIRSCLRGEG